MLGKSLKQFTTQFNARARSVARDRVATGKSLFMPPTTPDLQTVPPELQANLLEAEAAAIEAAAAAELEKNINFNPPDIVEVIERECYANAEKFVLRNTSADYSALRRPQPTEIQKRILRWIFTYFPELGRFRYMTVGYSAPKKSGKTSISAWVGYYFNRYVLPPNKVLLVANDRDQAHGRAFQAIKPSLYQIGADIKESQFRAVYPNGSVMESITSDAASEAGAHYILTLWTELWAFYTASKVSLWAEVSPIPTEPCSMRWFDSYMGYEDKSPLLLELYKQIFLDTSETRLHPKARAVPELEDIRTTDIEGNSIPCCYERPDLNYFLYLDHELRMPWQRDEKFFVSAGVGMTEADKVRLYQNRWQKSENKFIKKTRTLEKSFERGADIPHVDSKRWRAERFPRMVFAIDAASGLASANTGLLGVFEDTREMLDQETGEIKNQTIWRTGYARAWGGYEIDLNADVMAELYRLYQLGVIHDRKPDAKEKPHIDDGCRAIEVHYDPTEMRQVAIDFRKNHKLLLKPFDQTADRLRADTFLQTAYEQGRIDNIEKNDLYDHLDAASAELTNNKDNSKRVRIVQAGTQPIDLAVCQSMAVWRHQERPPAARRRSSLAIGKAKIKF